MMRLFDTHCHLDDDVFQGKQLEMVEECARAGVCGLVNAAWDRRYWGRALAMCTDLRRRQSAVAVLPCLGIHPMYIDEAHWQDHVAEMEGALSPDICAIGEIGLDYMDPKAALCKELQSRVFVAQLDVARKHGLPVLLHVRKAYGEALRILRSHPLPAQCGDRAAAGIAHAFAGSAEDAAVLTALGFKFGIGGIVTWTRATRRRDVIRQLPEPTIVLETDAPDIPLEGAEPGKPNSPIYLPRVFAALCELCGKAAENRESFAETIAHNTYDVFPQLTRRYGWREKQQETTVFSAADDGGFAAPH